MLLFLNEKNHFFHFHYYALQTVIEETKLRSRLPLLLKICKNVISFRRLFIVETKTEQIPFGNINIESWKKIKFGYKMRLLSSIWFCAKQTFRSADKTPLQILVMSYVASFFQLWLSTVAPVIQA